MQALAVSRAVGQEQQELVMTEDAPVPVFEQILL